MLSFWFSLKIFHLEMGYPFPPYIFVLTLYSIDTHFDASASIAFENIVGKGEIAGNEQFFLFHNVFFSIR